jgi:hypothetical protein
MNSYANYCNKKPVQCDEIIGQIVPTDSDDGYFSIKNRGNIVLD